MNNLCFGILLAFVINVGPRARAACNSQTMLKTNRPAVNFIMSCWPPWPDPGAKKAAKQSQLSVKGGGPQNSEAQVKEYRINTK